VSPSRVDSSDRTREASVDTSRSDRRTRILWLIKGLGAGGAERLLCLAAKGRDREAFECEVAYLLPWKDAMVGDLERAGVPVTCLRGGKEWDLSWTIRLRRLLDRRRIDIMHVHSPYVAGFARLVARSLPAKRRPRVVYTEHLPWPGYRLPTRLLNAVTFPLDDAHVAVSEAVRESVSPRLGRRLDAVVHGIQSERVQARAAERDESRRELGIAPDELLVGTVGNVRAQKRYPDLLEAARLVIDSGTSARFAAAGAGSSDPRIRAQHARLRLGDGFRFLGYVDDATRFLAGCDLFVLASEYEGLPVAMMEALALGLPVVATSVPGIRGEVRDGEEALLVPVGRPDLLADAIVTLARDPALRSRMSSMARSRADRFDMTAAINRMETIYRNVMTRT
jgi:glycosyltransferase involved in cell wall biosynthesis